jgi:hypothetical protein
MLNLADRAPKTNGLWSSPLAGTIGHPVVIGWIENRADWDPGYKHIRKVPRFSVRKPCGNREAGSPPSWGWVATLAFVGG